jgi:hypothetical protein
MNKYQRIYYAWLDSIGAVTLLISARGKGDE